MMYQDPGSNLEMRRIKREIVISDLTTAEIRSAILDGTLPPGSRVRQEELAARLGVSRAPIRQALLVLERDGLVRRDGPRGVVIAPLEPQFIGDIYDLRSAIDAHVADMLAARGSFDPGPFREIVAEGRSAATAMNLSRLIDLDSRFHMGLYEAAGNRVQVEVMHAQWAHIRRAMAITLTTSGYPWQVWDEHVAIIDAITRREAGKARELARTHTQNARMVLIEHLGAAERRFQGLRAGRVAAG